MIARQAVFTVEYAHFSMIRSPDARPEHGDFHVHRWPYLSTFLDLWFITVALIYLKAYLVCTKDYPHTENSSAAIEHQRRQVKGTTAEPTQCGSSKMNTVSPFTRLLFRWHSRIRTAMGHGSPLSEPHRSLTPYKLLGVTVAFIWRSESHRVLCLCRIKDYLLLHQTDNGWHSKHGSSFASCGCKQGRCQQLLTKLMFVTKDVLMSSNC